MEFIIGVITGIILHMCAIKHMQIVPIPSFKYKHKITKRVVKVQHVYENNVQFELDGEPYTISKDDFVKVFEEFDE